MHLKINGKMVFPCNIYSDIAQLFQIKKVPLKPANERNWPIERQKDKIIDLEDRKMLFQKHVIDAAKKHGYEDHRKIKIMKLLMGLMKLDEL